MASVIDICNLALAHLGDEANISSISPPDGSAQADHCKRYYPIARDSLLAMHPWAFATRRAPLASIGTPPEEWEYQYALPSDFLRAQAVLIDGATETGHSEDYVLEMQSDGSMILLTNIEEPTLKYTALVTDAARFPVLFVNALSRLLAANLAGPLLKGEAGRAEAKAQYQMFQLEFGKAASNSDNQKHAPAKHTVGWIGVR